MTVDPTGKQNFVTGIQLAMTTANSMFVNFFLMCRSLRLAGNSAWVIILGLLYGCAEPLPPHPSCEFFAVEIEKTKGCIDHGGCAETGYAQDVEYLKHLREELAYCQTRSNASSELP